MLELPTKLPTEPKHKSGSQEATDATSAGWQPECRADWPTPTTTWARYFYIGRWNYLKGLLAAMVIGLIASAFWGPTAGWTVMGIAVTYIAVSAFGLYLLYGPPSNGIYQKLFALAELAGDERILDVHFGTYRSSRHAIELLPQAQLTAVGIHDPEHETEPAVLDVWKFERPPVGHPRFQSVDGEPSNFPVDDGSQDVVLLGFGIHEVHDEEERERMMGEIHRVLAPNGKVLLLERGWSPLLLFVFGPLFLHFTPAKVWDAWLRKHFENVVGETKFGMVDLFVAK